jgi:hypothetical protein
MRQQQDDVAPYRVRQGLEHDRGLFERGRDRDLERLVDARHDP